MKVEPKTINNMNQKIEDFSNFIEKSKIGEHTLDTILGEMYERVKVIKGNYEIISVLEDLNNDMMLGSLLDNNVVKFRIEAYGLDDVNNERRCATLESWIIDEILEFAKEKKDTKTLCCYLDGKECINVLDIVLPCL